jgi:hypothetical protein
MAMLQRKPAGMGFLTRWQPVIQVVVSPGLFSFTDADYHRSVAPVIHLSANPASAIHRGLRRVGNSNLAVAGIGDRPLSVEYSVELLKPGQALPAGLTKFDCLEAFVRGVFIEMIDRHFVRLKPRVVVSGIERIDELMAGYSDVILEQALITAGANLVTFE